MATDVAFCNLAGMPLEHGLALLLEQLHARGDRVLVLVGSAQRVEALNVALWTWRPDSFLPHGAAGDGAAEEQPIWLTDTPENANGARVLVLLDGADSDIIDSFRECYYLFDRNDDEARDEARDRWRRYRDSGRAVAYWEPSAGGWRQQA